jgi:hypothetical protein
MLESELEPEFVSLLRDLRRPDPALEPGNQREFRGLVWFAIWN